MAGGEVATAQTSPPVKQEQSNPLEATLGNSPSGPPPSPSSTPRPSSPASKPIFEPAKQEKDPDLVTMEDPLSGQKTTVRMSEVVKRIPKTAIGKSLDMSRSMGSKMLPIPLTSGPNGLRATSDSHSLMAGCDCRQCRRSRKSKRRSGHS